LGEADTGLSLTVPPDWVRLDRSNVDEWAAGRVSADDARRLHLAVFNNAFVDGVFVVEPTSRARTSIDASCLPPTSESLDARRPIEILKAALESSGAHEVSAGTHRIAGHEGARATYVLHVASGDVVGATYVFSDSGRHCTIKTLTDKPARLGSVLARIVESIRAEH
jgi:hypothetical protein